MRLGRGVLAYFCLVGSAFGAQVPDGDLPAMSEAQLEELELAEPEPDVIASEARGVEACKLGRNPALFLFYTSIGGNGTFRFLKGCPGEVVTGEKTEGGPQGPFKTARAQKAGGRTAFVMGDHGILIRNMLKNRGVERTRRYLQKKLDSGYDYIVIDEITAHPDWADGSTVNKRFRQLLLKLPKRKVIAYVSIDLTMWDGGGAKMKARRNLLRALKLRGRSIALEVYLHTGEVMNGAAPGAMRKASDRLADAVIGLPNAGFINRRAITVLGASIRQEQAQFNYLDRPSDDLESLRRQGKNIAQGTARLRQQNGIGFYFIGPQDIQPLPGAPYQFDDLTHRMRLEMRRFKE